MYNCEQIMNSVLLRASAGLVQASQIHDKFINSMTTKKKPGSQPVSPLITLFTVGPGRQAGIMIIMKKIIV